MRLSSGQGAEQTGPGLVATDLGHPPDGALARRLREARRWCDERASRVRPEGCLRHPDLGPPARGGAYQEGVSHVVRRRRALLAGAAAQERANAGRAGPTATGRLLVFFPDYDLGLGAAREATGGYFDANCEPPWDTWLAFFRDSCEESDQYRDYVLAWVPAPFVGVTEEAIAVSMGALGWLSETAVSARRLFLESPALRPWMRGLAESGPPER
jgi:hypothetical protein